MSRRSDTRFGTIWIARGLPAVLMALALANLLPAAATAQILGSQTPGTPGALEGEYRPGRPATTAPLRNSSTGLRGPDPEISGAPASTRSGVKRNPNTAAKRQVGSGQTRPGGFPGASPAGTNPGVPTSAAQRGSRDFTGSRLGARLDPAAAAPPLGRPGVAATIAPGLPEIPAPATRRAPREDDPYAPLGIRAGSFLLRPALETSAGYDTNPARSGVSRKGSPLYRIEGELNATSEWSRHQLDIGLRGAYTGYTAIENANRPEGDARIALRLDATRDLSFDMGLTARVDTENPSNVNLPGGTSSRVPYYVMGASLGGTQRFGRLSLGLRGTVDRSLYSDVEIAGVTVSQESRNYTAYGLRLRGGYELAPGITPFAEVGVDNRVHDLTRDASGFRRDSQGLTIRAGSSFELARHLTGEIGAGYTFRHYEDARLAYLRAPVVDASLTWSASPLTTVNVRAQSEIVETTIANSAGGVAYRGTMTLTHAFLWNFTGTASLGLSRTDYDGVNRTETGLNAGMRLEYKFNRLMAVRGSYAFERLKVNTPGETYNAHTFLLGMRVTP